MEQHLETPIMKKKTRSESIHHGTFEKWDSEHECFPANLFAPEIEEAVFQYASGCRGEYVWYG